MQVINTNISSLNSQRHLNSTQSALSTSLERLSSGKRINNAKDDAAGLGISERMTTQINGMNQAIRNARDGISMSQTAEGALSTSSDMLQRIRTLAVQSSNATNASLDRQAIQDEVNELTSELNRIAQTTTFNGQKLLDGTLGAQNYQVGANAGDLITASGSNFQTNVYGNNRVQANGTSVKLGEANTTFGTAPAPATAYDSPELTINGSLGSAKVAAGDATTTAKALATSVNNVSDKTGVTATARTEAFVEIDTAGSFSLLVQSDNAKEMTVSFTVPAGETGTADGLAEAINAFNAISSKTGITAEFDVANKGIKLVNASGNDIKVANNLEAVANTTGTAMLDAYKADGTPATATPAANLTAKTAGGDLITAFVKGVVTYDSEASFSLASTAADTSAFGIANGTKPAAATKSGSSKLNSVSELDLTTFKSAQLAIAICDSAINRIDKEMARYGALQSRFDATIKNLEVNSENTSNARSRIKDADYAAETAELSRATILQQAGTAMLAQANQRPQTVLSLLG